MESLELATETAAFARRHLGSTGTEIKEMLGVLGVENITQMVKEIVPESIRLNRPLALEEGLSEAQALHALQQMATRNQVFRSLIGQGYYGCFVPPVIQRNIFENPGWYTAYTPYQAEIAQGRLEALLNYQTVVCELTGLPLANASLLDEGTAAAEAMNMLHHHAHGKPIFWASNQCHPQTLAVMRTRAEPLGIDLRVVAPEQMNFESGQVCGVLLSYPDSDGRLWDPTTLIAKARQHGVAVVLAADLLALTLLRSPGELGADVVIGSAQRFGVPMGAGGPHAAFFAARSAYQRLMPGRIIGVSKDARGVVALRMALQTREQHIRREKATSNICTSQVLLAVMAGMYAVYHGPEGLKAIARRVHHLAQRCAEGLKALNIGVVHEHYFDTLRVRMTPTEAELVQQRALEKKINLRMHANGDLGMSFDERCDRNVVQDLFYVFSGTRAEKAPQLSVTPKSAMPSNLLRTDAVLQHETFQRYHSEHEMLRYLHRLETKDLSLNTSMIPLGSCTMKLNATAEMLPVSWPEFSSVHPFAPAEQLAGYHALFQSLAKGLAEITGFDAVSLQPNAGSQGEYAGLLAIRAYHRSRGEGQRNVCLIPTSAHGTNPASAVLAGFVVVAVRCDANGNIDLVDLAAKAQQHKDQLGALMVTYPSTHGVYEAEIRRICEIVHTHGAQVYMDGANMNAQVGLCRPGDFGADVVHLNLHKTFCIPHGGGGPGVGPIAVKAHLAPFLPADPLQKETSTVGPVASAAFGSASILPISWMYITMMGRDGLRQATELALLNANYMAKCLEPHYSILYRGPNGRVAHEFILDFQPFKKTADIEVEDVAKRLMDYGFHAPTMSWPVPGTIMIEPTESESKAELDRFCAALIAIREEIREIESGQMAAKDSPLKNAPHPAAMIASDNWQQKYSREKAAYPAPWLRDFKYWPPVARIDNAYGDRNLFCTCAPVSS